MRNVIAAPLLAPVALLAAATPAAVADTVYGGTAIEHRKLADPALSILRRDDGRIRGRVALGLRCRRFVYSNLALGVSGRMTSATRFTAVGSVRPRRSRSVRVTVRGTISGDAVTGRVRIRPTGMSGCRGDTGSYALRAASAPGGGHAIPPARARFMGLTTQRVGITPLPISVLVAENRRGMSAVWNARMTCGPRGAVEDVLRFSPHARIRRDGSFRRTERYTLRYGDGTVDRYRVVLAGRFLEDGAVGTIRARMQTSGRGLRYHPCDSGLLQWAARP